jgi:hypothetical protein
VKLVVLSLLPAVNVIAPLDAVVVIVPAPAIDPTVSEAFTLYVAPDATVTAVLLLKLPVTVNVPALIVVLPV